MGITCIASGDYSVALGASAEATGISAISLGNNTVASGNYSVAMGVDSVASGLYSTAMGSGTDAIGDYSTAMGGSTDAEGDYSVAMGRFSRTTGAYSTVIGYDASALANYSTALGRFTAVGGSDSIVMGHGIDNTHDLQNNTANTLMVGFNRQVPTLTVSSYTVNIDAAAGSSGDVLTISTGTVNLFRFAGTGNAYANGSWATGGADYAEWFVKEGDAVSGDIIGLNLATGKARKYESGDALLGICSSRPGFVGNRDINKSDEDMQKDFILVGLVGQLTFDSGQVTVTSGIVETKDNKRIGYLLSDGKVFLKM